MINIGCDVDVAAGWRTCEKLAPKTCNGQS